VFQVLDVLEIEITKTSNGLADYVQVRSPAAFPVNIVLVAAKIIVKDTRPSPTTRPATPLHG
jgi:hypothetical protein